MIESNRIERIKGAKQTEIDAHERFIRLPYITIPDLQELVYILEPTADLRVGLNITNVKRGGVIAPASGPDILDELNQIIAHANKAAPDAAMISHPFKIHQRYEYLHPFTDGNGRSGRAIWLWGVLRGSNPLAPKIHGFLRAYYYQSLETYTRAIDLQAANR